MTIRPISNEDVMFWPDGAWCYRHELADWMGHRSDDYEVIPEGTPRYYEVTCG